MIRLLSLLNSQQAQTINIFSAQDKLGSFKYNIYYKIWYLLHKIIRLSIFTIMRNILVSMTKN